MFRTKSVSRRFSSPARLSFESLESRQLLANDVCFALVQNAAFPFDVNQDSYVSPIDVLILVNHANRETEDESCDANLEFRRTMKTDVDGDLKFSPSDALLIVNYLNRMGAAHARLTSGWAAEPVESEPGDNEIQIGEDAFVIYNSETGEIRVDTASPIRELRIRSKSGIFHNDLAQNLDGPDDIGTDGLLQKSAAAGFLSLSLGNVAESSLDEAFVTQDVAISGQLLNGDLLSSEDVTFELEVRNDSGTQIDTLPIGAEADVVIFVEDTRFGPQDFERGIFTAFLDFMFDNSRLELVGAPEFSSNFNSSRQWTVSDAGNEYDEIGAFISSSASSGRLEFFRQRVRATSLGTAVISTNAAEDIPSSNIVVLSHDAPRVDTDRVDYGFVSLDVTIEEMSTQVGADTFVIYDPSTGEVRVETETLVTTLELISKSGIFTGEPALNLTHNDDFMIDQDSDTKIFKLDANGFGSLSFGNVAQPGLEKEFLDHDLVVNGSPMGGGILSSEDVFIDLNVTDAFGNRIDEINLGDEFELEVSVDDQRYGPLSFDRTVLATYLDINFDSSIVQPIGDPRIANDFDGGRSGNVSDGQLDELGAFRSSADSVTGIQLLVTQTFRAIGVGDILFTSEPADLLPQHHVLVLGDNTPIAHSRVDFGTAALKAVDESPLAQDLVAFAKDLADSGTIFYGAAWCPHCTDQKEAFDDGQEFLPFVEVTDFQNSANLSTLNNIGVQEGISSFPTWQFPDQSRVEGTQSIETLSELSGVPIPMSNVPTLIGLDDTEVLAGSPLHVPLNGWDPNGGPLTYTVTSSHPDVVDASLITGNRSLLIDIEDPTRGAPAYGEMLFQLFEQRVPRVTERIIALAEAGFYDGLTFHRIIDNFMMQGGDPEGMGGGLDLPDFDDQYHLHLQHNRQGILSMAKSGDDTNNSQFFITDTTTRHLDFNHSIFGQLIEGEKNRDAATNTHVNGSAPDPRVFMKSVTVVEDQENGLLMLKAVDDATGSSTITVVVNDENGHSFEQTFEVTVVPDSDPNANSNPFLDDLPELSTTSVETFSFDLPGRDAEGDAIFFYGEPSGAREFELHVNENTGRVTVTPPADFAGILPADFWVSAQPLPERPSPFDFNPPPYDEQNAVSILVRPSVPTIDLESSSDTGLFSDDNITSARELVFEISNVVPGATVELEVLETESGTSVQIQKMATDNIISIQTDVLSENGEFMIVARQSVDDLRGDDSEILTVQILREDLAEFDDMLPSETLVGELFAYDFNHPIEGQTGARYSVQPVDALSIDEITGVLNFVPTDPGTVLIDVGISDLAGNTESIGFNVEVVSPVIDTPDLVGFANGLTDSGAILYGAVWDANTTAQRAMFEEASRFLPFVDVTDTNRELTQEATDNGISQLPTWVFANGTRLQGQQTLEAIAMAADLALEAATTPWLNEIPDTTLSHGSPLHIPLNALDYGGAGLSYSVSSTTAGLIETEVLTGNPHMKVNVAGYGSMVFEIYQDRVPELAAYLMELVQSGFYTGRPFYIVNDQMMQAGENQIGAGSVADQFHVDLQHNRSGILSLAKLVDDGNGTDFVISSTPNREADFHNSIVGQLVEGENVREAMESVAKLVGGEPKFPVTIESVEIFDNSEDAILRLSTNAVAGATELTVTATDDDGDFTARSFVVSTTADPFNSGPYLLPMQPVTASPGEEVTIQLAAIDAEGDRARFQVRRIGDQEIDFDFDATSGEIRVTPPEDFVGRIELQVSVSQFGVTDQIDRFDREKLIIDVTAAAIGADFNSDTIIDARDIDILCQAIRSGSMDSRFDVNADGRIDTDDHGFLTSSIMGVFPGDSNLDGVFSSSDLTRVFIVGEFEDNVAENSTWATGDWNCDGEFDSADFVAAFQAGGYDPNA